MNMLPVRRPELLLIPNFAGGPSWIEDRSSGEQYRMGEQEYFLLSRLDGTLTAPELQAGYQIHFGETLADDELADFLNVAHDFLLSPELSEVVSAGLAAELADYKQTFANCEPLAQRSRQVIAGAATHDRRNFGPFPVYVDRALGPLKWTANGKPLIDYWMGHGSLLFGHGFAPVVDAVNRQMLHGTHMGAGHEAEIRWAELICQTVPSAERVRFTASGTEATQLALRVARAFTGRPRVVKFHGHFHGWHDESMAHFYPQTESGFSPGVVANCTAIDHRQLDQLEVLLAKGDVAAVLLEPGGGGSGDLDWSFDYLRQLADLTHRFGTLLIFDEVISGFRYSPGGVQELAGVLPDLTTLAKILSGGLPGGAVVGRKDVMAVFGTGVRLACGRRAHTPHTGTFNGNPLSAVAGIAMLEAVQDGTAQRTAKNAASLLARLVNQSALTHGVDVQLVTHDTSIYHILIGGQRLGMSMYDISRLHASHPERYARLRRSLLIEGVDTPPLHGWVSAVHDPETTRQAAAAFDRVFERLQHDPGFRI